MEGALGQAREHVDHRIGTLLLIHAAELQHVRAVREESATQEDVHEKYVPNLKRNRRIVNEELVFANNLIQGAGYATFSACVREKY